MALTLVLSACSRPLPVTIEPALEATAHPEAIEAGRRLLEAGLESSRGLSQARAKDVSRGRLALLVSTQGEERARALVLTVERPLETGWARHVAVVQPDVPRSSAEGEGELEALERATVRVLKAAELLLRHANPEGRDEALEALRSEDPLERWAGAEALRALGDPAAIPHLVERLQGDVPLEIRDAIGGLVELRAREAVPALIARLKGTRPMFVQEVLYALGELGGDEARGYLYTVSQGHDHPALREVASSALEELERTRTADEGEGQGEKSPGDRAGRQPL